MVIYIVIAVIIVVAAILIYRKTRKKEEKDMAAGLQVFDENGTLVVDMQTRISKVLGTVTTDWRTGSVGSLTDERLLDGTMWYAITELDFGGDYSALEVKVNGSTLSWAQKHPSIGGHTLIAENGFTFIYGIY